jgi:hypothetical protein
MRKTLLLALLAGCQPALPLPFSRIDLALHDDARALVHPREDGERRGGGSVARGGGRRFRGRQCGFRSLRRDPGSACAT